MAIEKPLVFILKILRIMDNGAVNVVKSFVGDRTGDYRYLGEIKKGMHIVSYMFTDDASTEDGAFLAVGTVHPLFNFTKILVIPGRISDKTFYNIYSTIIHNP